MGAHAGDVLRDEEIEAGHREQFLARVAVLGDHRLIDVDERQRLLVVDRERLRVVLEQQPIALLGRADLLARVREVGRGLVKLGDVLADEDPAGHAAVDEVVAGGLDDHLRPVLAPVAAAAARQQSRRLDQALRAVELVEIGELVGGDQVPQAHAQQLVAGEAVGTCGRGARRDDP